MHMYIFNMKIEYIHIFCKNNGQYILVCIHKVTTTKTNSRIVFL